MDTNGVSTTGNIYADGIISASSITVNGTTLSAIGFSGSGIVSGTTGVTTQSNGIISITTNGTTANYFDTSGRLVTPGVSVTTLNGISSTNGYFSGNVGIGTTTPGAGMDVSGSIISRPLNAGSSTTISFANTNSAYTTASCGAFTLSGMQDGGTYALVVQGASSGTCSFTHSGLTIRLPASHGATTAGTHTYYSFQRLGTNVYVSWIKGY